MAKRGRARSVVAISPGGGWEEHDTAEAERMGRSARQRYEQLFTAAAMGRDYANLYQRVLDSSCRR